MAAAAYITERFQARAFDALQQPNLDEAPAGSPLVL